MSSSLNDGQNNGLTMLDTNTAGAVDCDLHPAVPDMDALLPYLDQYWQEQVTVRGIDTVDSGSYPPNNPLSGRSDWRVKGTKPGTSLANLQKDALDAFGSSLGICNVIYGAQSVYNADMGLALCRATNDWLAREWLDRDPRLRGSILVPLNNPALAVEEIERVASSDSRFVQVLLWAMTETPLGRRQNWPIYEAAVRHKLAVGIHAASTYRNAPSYNGWPSYYIEDYAAQAQAFQGQLLSLIYEGVFNAFPDLRVVLIESGVSWLPSFLWRSASTWRATRFEVPWVEQSPAEIVRRQVRLTAQPFDVPGNAAIVARIVEQIGSEEMLLFATDYPHWQFDGADVLPEGISAGVAEKMRVANPLETYPRLRSAVQ